MKTVIPYSVMERLINASRGSLFRTAVAQKIAEHFKSAHYLSSKLICDCVILNILLNDNITPTSADEIITTLRRENKSLYTTVNSAFMPVEDSFNEYAKTVLNEQYDEIREMNLRNANYMVYVFSVDMSRTNVNRDEIIFRAYTYEELIDGKLPKYE